MQTRIPGAMASKLWKNLGNVASKEGKSCQKPKIFGAAGQTCGKTGNCASEERTPVKN